MLGKLVDGNLIRPSQNEFKKIIITNPSIESLKYNLGYKDLIVDEQPEYDMETHYLEAVYEETEDTIINHWEVKEVVLDENQLESEI